MPNEDALDEFGFTKAQQLGWLRRNLRGPRANFQPVPASDGKAFSLQSTGWALTLTEDGWFLEDTSGG